MPTTFKAFMLGIKEAAQQALASSINTFFNDLVDGSKSAGDALKDFVGNFARAIGQIILQAMAAYVALLIVNAIPGGLAVTKALDFAATAKHANDMKTPAKQNHTGGIVGRDGKDVAVGGADDIKSNEVLTVLEKGEEVLTANDPRHRRNYNAAEHFALLMPKYHGGGIAGMAPDSDFMQNLYNMEPKSAANSNSAAAASDQYGMSVRIINNVDESVTFEHVSSPNGEKVVVNTIKRNASAIKRILEDN